MTAFLIATLALASAADRATVIVAVGAPGAEEYASQFAEWAARWKSAAESGQADVIIIGNNSASEAADTESATDLDRLRNSVAGLALVAEDQCGSSSSVTARSTDARRSSI